MTESMRLTMGSGKKAESFSKGRWGRASTAWRALTGIVRPEDVERVRRRSPSSSSSMAVRV